MFYSFVFSVWGDVFLVVVGRVGGGGGEGGGARGGGVGGGVGVRGRRGYSAPAGHAVCLNEIK
mgnify:CR=1 FL=1